MPELRRYVLCLLAIALTYWIFSQLPASFRP